MTVLSTNLSIYGHLYQLIDQFSENVSIMLDYSFPEKTHDYAQNYAEHKAPGYVRIRKLNLFYKTETILYMFNVNN